MRSALRMLGGFGVSIVAHVLVGVFLAAYGALPEIEGEFHIPTEIEFGVVDTAQVEVGAEPAPAPPQAAPPAPTTPPPATPSDAIAADAGRPHRRDAGVRDAGVSDATIGEAGVADASADSEGGLLDAAVGAGDGGRRAPRVARGTEGPSRQVAGAQLTLRIDFGRVRGTSLEPITSQFLGEIRDFQAVLGDSGIDPVRDLEQFLMSSPDPVHRDRYVFLGRSAHDAAWARERVAALAAHRGQPAEWITRFGYPSAPWLDADDVGRVVLLLDEQHFVLCREADAQRVVAWLAGVAENADRPIADGPALALGVADDEVLSLEGVNLPIYAQGAVQQYTPDRARVSILTDEGHEFDLAVRAVYGSPDAAQSSTEYWNGLREQAAAVPLVRALRIDATLNALALTQDEREVRANAGLNSAQVTQILGFVQMQMAAMYAQWDRQRAIDGRPPAPR